MATVTNNFNTGLAAGTAITTANSDDNGAGNAFDNVSGSGTNARTFETRDAGLCGQFSTTGAGQAYAEYSTSVGSIAAGSPVYGSADFMLPALPGAGLGGTRIALVLTAADGFIAEWRINDTGKLEQRTGAGGLTNTSVNSVTAGQWFKVHFTIVTISATVGQLQCRLFLDPNSNSPTETLTSTATQNLGSTAAAKYRMGTARTFTDFTTQVDNIRWSSTSQLPVEAGVLIGPVTGNLSDTGFTTMYRTSDSAGQDHRLVVSLAPDLSSPVYSSVQVPDADGFVKLDITGLTADTPYFYGVEVDSVLLSTGRGQVTTDPAPGVASYSVAFGSCQYDTPTAVTFDAIKDYSGPYGQVRRFIHMGDMNYRDWSGSNTAADMVAQYQTSMASASMSPLLAEVAMTYAWDNHDWAGSFSDKTAPAGPLVAATYRQVIPSYALPATDGVGIWHTWVMGRVRFIQIDPRSQRDAYNAPNGPTKTMLGVEQKAWLKTQLQAPEPVKIICDNMYWRHDAALGDRWGSYPDEFIELNDFIDDFSIGLTYVIFGDRHALCADDGSTLATRGRPQAGGAPFQQGSTGVSEVWSQGYYDDPGTMQAFGLLHITDNGDQIIIDYEGKTAADGVTRISMSTVVEVDQFATATSVDDTSGIGTPTVAPGPVVTTASSVTSGEAFGLPAVFGGVTTVYATGLGSDLAFGTPTIATQTILTATAVPSGLLFGLPAVTTGPITVTATSVTTGEAFGLPQAYPGPITITATGLGSDLAFGVPSAIPPAQYLQPQGVASALGFGITTATLATNLVATSVEPTAAVGSPYAYTGAVTLAAIGIGSVLEFGLPEVSTGDITIVATGVPSGYAPGIPTVSAGPIPSQTLAPTGVASGLAFGLPGLIIGSITVRAWSVDPVAEVGSPAVSTGPVTLLVSGIASELTFGDTHIIGGNNGQVIAPTGVASGEAFGTDVWIYIGGGGNDCECSVLVDA